MRRPRDAHGGSKLGNERTNAFYRSLGFRVAREMVTPEKRILNEYELDVAKR